MTENMTHRNGVSTSSSLSLGPGIENPTLEVTIYGGEVSPADGWEHYAYTAVIVNTTHPERQPAVVPYSTGLAWTEPPTAKDVLESLALDYFMHGDLGTFEQWADDQGGDPDSRALFGKWEALNAQNRAMERLIGNAAMEALCARFED